MKNPSRFLLAAVLAAAFAGAGRAQNRTFTNQYSFGDSLSDSGNLLAATTALGAPNPPAPYFQGRFSNGRVFTEQLGNTLALTANSPSSVKTSLNFAFGGATAAGASTLPPSFSTQLALFQARAITPAKTDLFTVFFGANDVIPVLTNPATPTNPGLIDGAGAAAATATAAGIQTLVGLGAKNIVVAGLPNLGATPRSLAGGATGAAFGLRATTAFNAELFGRLGRIAAGTADLNLTYVDVQGVLDRIVLDYQTLGYANNNRFFLAPAAQGGGVGDPNSYIFWDDIHPSAKTHGLFAAIVNEELNPEPVIGFGGTQGSAALALQGLGARAHEGRLAQLAGSARATGRGEVYASFNYANGDRVVNGLTPKFAYDAQVVTAGFDSRVGDGTFLGAALQTGRLVAKVANGGGDFAVEDATGRLYAQWRADALSVSFDADYGTVRVKGIHRTTAFAGFRTNGKTAGTHWGAGLTAAWALKSAGLAARPWIGLRTERVNLNGYAESDVPSLGMGYDAQQAKSSAGAIGLDLGSDTKLGEKALHLDFGAAWHGELGSRTRTLSGKLANNFTRTTAVGVKDGDGNGVTLGVAGTLALTKKWSATLGYAADLRNHDKLSSRVSLAIQSGF
jgi:outer membrane lipase/esterase